MNHLDLIILQAADQGETSSWPTIIMFGLMFAVFYLFIIRPQAKKNKAQANFREELKKGDKVVTNGGIHGKILEVRDTTFIIETEGQGRLKVEKSGISMEASAPKKDTK